MSDNRQPSQEKSLRPLLLFLGFTVLGMALALLLFGGDLLGRQQTANRGEGGVLTQVDELDTGTDVDGTSPQVTRLSGATGAPQVGEQAPDFVLNDLEGTPVSLTDLRGRPVIINFWATWCVPCEVEMPELQAAYEAYQDEGLALLAVNREEDVDTIRNFYENDLEVEITFTTLRDEETIAADLYGIFNMPSTYFVNAEGTITGLHRGPLTQGQIDDYLADTIEG